MVLLSIEIGDGIYISPCPVERLLRVEVSAVQLVAAYTAY